MLAPKRVTPRKILFETLCLLLLGAGLVFTWVRFEPASKADDRAQEQSGASLLPPLPAVTTMPQVLETAQYQALQAWVELPVEAGSVGRANPFSTTTLPALKSGIR